MELPCEVGKEVFAENRGRSVRHPAFVFIGEGPGAGPPRAASPAGAFPGVPREAPGLFAAS